MISLCDIGGICAPLHKVDHIIVALKGAQCAMCNARATKAERNTVCEIGIL